MLEDTNSLDGAHIVETKKMHIPIHVEFSEWGKCTMWGVITPETDTIQSCHCSCTVNFLNIRTPQKFVVIVLKFEQRGFTIEKCVQKM